MSDKSVIFYGIETDFFPVAYKLIEKMYAMREKLLFLCDNENEVSFYNSKLWTSVQLSFIPSGNKSTIPLDDAKFCYIWFSTEITFLNDPTCLLHNGIDVSDIKSVEKFQKIIDVFNLNDINSAKVRATFYRGNGFFNQKFWTQSDGSWNQGDLL